MTAAQRVIDEIGALVDEQLQQEASGYDWNINQPECRCGRKWHGLPTQRCPGSDSEGPMVRWEVRRKNDELDGAPVIMDHQAIEAYAATLGDLRRVMLAECERISVALADTWATIRRQIGALDPTAVQAAEREDGRPALPFPARTPPMWAVDATRTRRRRHL